MVKKYYSKIITCHFLSSLMNSLCCVLQFGSERKRDNCKKMDSIMYTSVCNIGFKILPMSSHIQAVIFWNKIYHFQVFTMETQKAELNLRGGGFKCDCIPGHADARMEIIHFTYYKLLHWILRIVESREFASINIGSIKNMIKILFQYIMQRMKTGIILVTLVCCWMQLKQIQLWNGILMCDGSQNLEQAR